MVETVSSLGIGDGDTFGLRLERMDNGGIQRDPQVGDAGLLVLALVVLIAILAHAACDSG